ncbi:MAG: TA system VapC family ribonuclease toxin [Steroidobacteraceae bacterium]
MTCIADANVLFPLLVQGHAAYEVAKAWWDEQPDANVGTCLLTRLAVLRLLTNRVAMNGAPVRPDDALKAWNKLSDDRSSFHIDVEPADHEPCFVSLVSFQESTPNLWTDAWLATLAMSLDYEMTTFNRGFKSFRELKLWLLEMPDR